VHLHGLQYKQNLPCPTSCGVSPVVCDSDHLSSRQLGRHRAASTCGIPGRFRRGRQVQDSVSPSRPSSGDTEELLGHRKLSLHKGTQAGLAAGWRHVKGHAEVGWPPMQGAAGPPGTTVVYRTPPVSPAGRTRGWAVRGVMGGDPCPTLRARRAKGSWRSPVAVLAQGEARGAGWSHGSGRGDSEPSRPTKAMVDTPGGCCESGQRGSPRPMGLPQATAQAPRP
jgi:hypothetical protein